MRKKPNQRRCYDGSQKCRTTGDGNGQRRIAARQEGHDVRRGSARAAANEDHAYGDFGRQLQHDAKQISKRWHDDELGEDADQHIHGF